MGLEKEKADIQIFMDDDGFPRGSSSPVLPEKSPDRDPNGLNSHLTVRVPRRLAPLLAAAPALPCPPGPARRVLASEGQPHAESAPKGVPGRVD